MIEKLLIHRFRGIYKGHLEDFARFNLLVGPNNTGKSAVLEMLYLGGVCGRECGLVVEATGDRFTAAAPLENDFLGFNPCSRLWARHGEKEEWEKSPATLTEDGTLVYRLPLDYEDFLREFRLVPPPSEETEYGGFSGKDKKSIAAFALPGAPEIPGELVPFKDEIEGLTGYVFLYQWYDQFVHKHSEKGLSTWALGGKRPDSRRVLFFDFHTAHGNFQSSFFEFARILPDWYRKIERSLGKIFPDMAGCRVEMVPAGEKEMRGEIRLPGRKPLPVDAFGDGARHAFKVLAGLVALVEAVDEEHPGLFLWEDPELFMHPATLGKLLAETINLVKKKPVQVFISTQSLEVIAWFGKMIVDKKLEAQALRTYTLTLSKGELQTKMHRGENLKEWLKSGFDPRFRAVSEDMLPFGWYLLTDTEGGPLW
ncbi:AAA family ATPase [Desulfofundulus thermobenzoicus]|uniref:AAA family ATPase n=1 Tax=Desulfofundulus thermobenzoicus TaxID=29376 RepID=A0A6N7IQF0_9FIRM|nr:ATP-binding protein [Desulfofundulus thermobenzoicus]MQL52305.1 AAA family ATPase [Desulfofundulus thermobenzoicus]